MDIFVYTYVYRRCDCSSRGTTTGTAATTGRHGVYFETAMLVFDDPNFVMLPDRTVEGEERWQMIGLVEGVLFLLVAHTVESEEEDEFIRIISAREATAHERGKYAEESYR
jgi:uncharacterized protein